MSSDFIGGGGGGSPLLEKWNEALPMGPEALHLLDDMLAAAWNTNGAGVWPQANDYCAPPIAG